MPLCGPKGSPLQKYAAFPEYNPFVPPLGVRYGAGGLLGGMDDGLHSGWLLTISNIGLDSTCCLFVIPKKRTWGKCLHS